MSAGIGASRSVTLNLDRSLRKLIDVWWKSDFKSLAVSNITLTPFVQNIFKQIQAIFFDQAVGLISNIVPATLCEIHSLYI